MAASVINGFVVYNESGEAERFAPEFGIKLGGGRVHKPVFLTPKTAKTEAGKGEA